MWAKYVSNKPFCIAKWLMYRQGYVTGNDSLWYELGKLATTYGFRWKGMEFCSHTKSSSIKMEPYYKVYVDQRVLCR